MGKLDLIRLQEYATKAKLWPNCPEAEDITLAVWAFLKEKDDFFEASLKEIDYFFRDEPKKTWINEEELQKNIEMAQLLALSDLKDLTLLEKIKLIQIYLGHHKIEGQLIFAGQKELVFDIKNVQQQAQLKASFPSMELKFVGAING